VFALGNTILGIGAALNFLLVGYMWVLIAAAIVSWVDANPRNRIVYYLSMATDPVVDRVRKLLPMKLRYFPIDLGFIVTFGIVIFLRFALAQTLIDLGGRMAAR
jgi:YggT family protein